MTFYLIKYSIIDIKIKYINLYNKFNKLNFKILNIIK